MITTVCQCDSNCLLQIEIKPKAKHELDDHQWFIISNKCKRGPEPKDVFVKKGPGYRIFTYLDTLGKTEKELLDEKFKEIVDEVKKMQPGQVQTFDLPVAIDFKNDFVPLYKKVHATKGALSDDLRQVEFSV